MFKFNELKTVHLEISTRCQASCPMCPRNWHGGQKNPYLEIADWSYEDFVKIFNQETLDQLITIYFCGNFGDPIMNDDLIKMCQYVKEHAPSMDIRIHTNGGARNKQWWKDLRESLPNNHTVVFALDGLEDTHHLYRIGTKYEIVVRNARYFIEAGGKSEWVFIKFKHNQHQVDEAERRSKELGFDRFTVKNTTRFVGEDKFSVLDKDGNVEYYLEPPEDNKVVFITPEQIRNFRTVIAGSEIDCYVKNNKEIYIDAHKKVFPCCFLASAPYNYRLDRIPFDENNTLSIVRHIKHQQLDQYYDLIESLGGIDNLSALDRSIKDIINDDRWQSAWEIYWHEKKLITCARVCGNMINNFSKPKDQFVKRVINEK
jgi:MoaA/NifB/PqqE/SkfB family radical SAM enzyme